MSKPTGLIFIDPPVIPEVGGLVGIGVGRRRHNRRYVGTLAVECVNVRVVECIGEILEA